MSKKGSTWDYTCTKCGRATPGHEKCRWCGEAVPDRRCCNSCQHATNVDFGLTEQLDCKFGGKVNIEELCKRYISVYRK